MNTDIDTRLTTRSHTRTDAFEQNFSTGSLLGKRSRRISKEFKSNKLQTGAYAQPTLLHSKAQQGNEIAQLTLAEQYLRNNQFSPAAYYFTLAAKNCAAAHFYLAEMSRLGLGTEPDTKKALGHYKKAAKMGSAEAQFHLAVLLQQGKEISQDLKKALYYYRQAAKHKYIPALINLSGLYSLGLGVKADSVRAFSYCLRAAQLGNELAELNVAAMFASGTGTAVDLEQAKYFLTSSASKGNKLAQQRLEELVISTHRKTFYKLANNN